MKFSALQHGNQVAVKKASDCDSHAGETVTSCVKKKKRTGVLFVLLRLNRFI